MEPYEGKVVCSRPPAEKVAAAAVAAARARINNCEKVDIKGVILQQMEFTTDRWKLWSDVCHMQKYSFVNVMGDKIVPDATSNEDEHLGLLAVIGQAAVRTINQHFQLQRATLVAQRQLGQV